MNLLNITDETYDATQSAIQQADRDETPSSAPSTDWLYKGYDPSTYLKAPGPAREVFFINQGRTRGTTFKIDTGGYVFSCLFDTGAEVSCMNVDTLYSVRLIR